MEERTPRLAPAAGHLHHASLCCTDLLSHLSPSSFSDRVPPSSLSGSLHLETTTHIQESSVLTFLQGRNLNSSENKVKESLFDHVMPNKLIPNTLYLHLNYFCLTQALSNRINQSLKMHIMQAILMKF